MGTTMALVLTGLATFLFGALYEAGCVAWVHYSERHQAGKAALVSSLLAAVQIAGVGESVHDIRMAPFFVVGYGVGSYVAVKLKGPRS